MPSSADVAGTLGERMVIYHCVDEFSKFTGTDETAILDMERGLMEKADMVVVSSSRLYETKRRHNPNTFLVTHGVDVAHFRSACLPETVVPADCAELQGPVIGFFGLIADWVDLEVVRYLAASRPEWSFLLIGEVQTDTTALQGHCPMSTSWDDAAISPCPHIARHSMSRFCRSWSTNSRSRPIR